MFTHKNILTHLSRSNKLHRLGQELGGSGMGLLFPMVLILCLRGSPK
jgi:hypothetical protein